MEDRVLLGNEELKKRLSMSFRSGKQSHCYLICGPEGSGKRTLAAYMSQALQCEGQPVPCGQCDGCRKVKGGVHPDVIVVDDSEKKSVQVAQIRQVQEDAFIRPNEGKKKIYLIPRAHLLTEQAQNALLKLIEEPPHYAVFLLLTANAEKLLPTVRSRSVELRMEPVPFEAAAVWLQANAGGADLQTLRAAHLRCGGFLGQTLQYLTGEDAFPLMADFVRAYADNDRYGITAVFAFMEKLPRDKLLKSLTALKRLMTEALAVRAGTVGSADAMALARRRTAPELADAAKALQTAMDRCAANIGAGHICGLLAATL
ncbi:MAG: DNA polymerase III subunit [Oscillospiraceae bacterium]|nr:DNA polymerase III subunit [Oscillospiraceae bacterium]